MKKMAKILLILTFSFLSLALVQGRAEAQVWETTSTSATPTSDRAVCLKNSAGNPIELNDFGVNISNVTFNVDTGTFTYKVNVAWSRCNLQGELSRAYAIYGPASICPISGWYGLNGTVTDCVKYVGNPPYSPPSDLKCSGGRTNSQCTTEAFSAAIIARQDPGFLDANNKRSYAQTFTIPNWTNVRSSSTSYSIKEQMCQYYKSVVFFTPIDVTNNRCESINITANWRKKPPPPPSLDVSCSSDTNTENAKITIKAVSNDPTDNGEILVKEDFDKNPPTSSKNLPSSNYTFDIDARYRDGRDHLYYVNFKDLNKSVTFGPNSQCKLSTWYFPWLQTKQGDVVADGTIAGQVTSGSGTEFLGARIDSSADKEAEFLVISAAGGGGPFCSTYRYILTNTNSQAGNCNNGTGYNFNSTSIDGSGGVDRVIAGVKQAFADNPVSAGQACSAKGIATASVSQTPAVMSTECTGGIIYKQSSGTLPSLMNLNKGKVTIFVDGDLTVTGPILYTLRTDLYPVTDPRLVPTLAIVVNGNVDITSNTTQIDAQIYTKGTIKTCSKNSTNTAAASIQDCSANKLLVNGSLNSKGGFDFRRTFIDEANRTPAELIKLTGTSMVIPPPGIEYRYFSNDFSGYKLDTSEYSPRF